MVVNCNILSKIFKSIFIFCFLFTSLIFGVEKLDPLQHQDVFKLIDNHHHQEISFELARELFPERRSQTAIYLQQKGINQRLGESYKGHIERIGITFFEKLINDIIKKELEFENSHYVFYHGQKKEFLLIQDLFEAFFKIAFKKAFDDFFILRSPDQDSEKFKNIQSFLNKYIKNKEIYDWNFDAKPHIQKILLSVNVSLFGNTYYLGESSFHYFLQSCYGNVINFHDFIKDTFKYFKYLKYYEKFKTKLEILYKILFEYEKNQTGILIQIFIPKKIVDNVAYRCKPWGLLYYKNLFGLNFFSKKPSENLEQYQSNKMGSIMNYYFMQTEMDAIQFRILLNSEIMLNPDSGVKMFRYYNETENIKKYKEEFSKLISEIEHELEKEKDIKQ